MKAPISWLKKFINLTRTPAEIAEILTLAGLEVEKIERDQFFFEGVIIGKITSVKPHPETDKLKIASVYDGSKSVQVVCGDLTIEEEDVVAFAKVGAKLTLRDGHTLEIKKAKLRGQESYGMLCSAAELGLSDDHDQILRLQKSAPLGQDIKNFLHDPTFDICLTPNLGYCRSMFGIARELGAHLNELVTFPSVQLKEDQDNPAHNEIQVTNEEHTGCLQYECRVIRGVQIDESPDWIKDWLEKTGHSIINNVVDVTNLIMEETGQPLHAFDGDKLPSRHIVIRNGQAGETIVTLDGEKRPVDEEMLLICDGEMPIAIAGIMGSLESGINEHTNTVILEAAQFHPSRIRKTSRKLGLRSDASARFENQIDPAGLRYALDRAAALIQEVAGGHVLKGSVSQSPHPYKPRFITARLSKINSLLGTKLSLNEVETYLQRLGMISTNDKEDLFQIKIPSFRTDLHEEIDIVEEIARLYGFNHIERKRPRHINSPVSHHPLFHLEREVRARLVSKGLQEFLTCNLISPEYADLELENGLFKSEYIRVIHAKSVEQSILRPSLLPGLLASVKHNQNNHNFNITAFEIGRVHFHEEKFYDEKCALGIILTGLNAPLHWEHKERPLDFYDIKGIVEDLADLLMLPSVSFTPSHLSTFHPGRQAAMSIGEERIGVLGEVHPKTTDYFEIKGRVLFCEIDLLLVEKLRHKRAKFSPLPQYPGSTRDLTLGVKKERSLENLFRTLRELREPLLKDVALIDIYEGDKAATGEKNVTFRLSYRSDEKTVDVTEVEKAHQKVVKKLQGVR